MKYLLFAVSTMLFCNTTSFAQTATEKKLAFRTQLEKITKKYKGTTGVGLYLIEDKDSMTVNGTHHYPTQSVYKFPLAMAILHLVDEGKLSLTQKIHVTKAELRENTWSPLKEKYPDSDVDLTLAELLEYSVSKSDNNACDILFGLAGGPKKVHQYIQSLGIKNMQIAATEFEMHQSWKVQYSNWSTPWAMTDLLQQFYLGKHLSKTSNDFLMKLMIHSSNSAARIKGLLPPQTIVAHKTGSSGDNGKGLIAATNDVGIISLANGKHLAISVFVSDTRESNETTEKIIAEIAFACFQYYSSI